MSEKNLYTSSIRLNNIVFSPVRKVLNRAKELEKEGRRIIHLEIGEPDFDTPQPIVEATIKALDKDKLTHYGSNAGDALLRENIATKMRRDKGLEINPDEILITVGAAEAIFVAIMALINPGDEVIILSPAFMNYLNCVQIAEGVPVYISLKEENEFQIDPQEVAARITGKTKMIILNNPHNPTGTVYHKYVLEEISQIIANRDILVLSDEIYDAIVYGGARHYSMSSFLGLKERTITINGFSKTYAMTGWRLGYLIANERFMPSFIKVHQYVATCAPTFIQAGAAHGMLESEQDIREMVAIFEKRKEILIKGLQEISGLDCVKPQGAFYVMVNITKLGLSAEEFAHKLLEDKGVAVVPGTGFGLGGEGYIRISYATSDDSISVGINKIKELVGELN